MANKNLFKSYAGKLLPAANTRNETGGLAYAFSPRHALAQYAATGCLNSTFYADARVQLAQVLALCAEVEPEFIARVALYARQSALMKDLPALLCAMLSVRSPGLMAEIFERVIDSPKMLRTFVQIMRSGAVGRKSLGTLPKRLIVQWLERRSDEQLFTGSVGRDPSLADIVKMVHPKPQNAARAALLGYLLGRPHDAAALSEIVRAFETYKASNDRTLLDTPDVPFQMLTALDLAAWEWKSIAWRASWQTTRMNLNTFARHSVFDDANLTSVIAARLRDAEAIRKARALPYQLLAAYAAATNVPSEVREALQDALDAALMNVPTINGRVLVFPDVSGSMHSPITGCRKGASSAVRCIDVAALLSAALLRTNPRTLVVPFETNAIPPERVDLNPRDSVMTNARKLAALPQGGTNCSAALKFVNDHDERGDLVIYVSDNESWVDSPQYGRCGGDATATMKQWARFQQRNPRARLICIDVQPNASTQTQERADIINVGGFSDQVFGLIAAVASGNAGADHWVSQIEGVRI